MTWKKITVKILNDKPLSDEDKDWVRRKVDDYWEDHPDVTNRYPRWKKYIAWVAGYQLFDYNKISKKLVEVPLARQRKLIFNKLKPYVRTLLAKMTQEQHQPSVMPATDDDDDLESARAGDKFVEGHADKIAFKHTLNQIKLWCIICNQAYLRVFWNPDMLGFQGYGKTEEGEKSPAMVDGDLDMECISPFNCRPDPLYTDRKKWRWFVYGDEVDASEVEDEYGLKEGSITEKSDVLDTAYDLQLQDEQDIIVGSPDKSDDITGRTCVLKEFWTKEVFILTAGTEVLRTEANPYGEIPFFEAKEELIPITNYEKAFSYNESLIKDAIPLQREYNRQASIVSIALDRASKLKVLAPLGSLLNKKQWTNDYGVFIDYNRNLGEPHQMKLDPFPMDVPRYKSDLEREMQGVMNLSPTSFGQLPERASHPSGTLVSQLIEQDDVVLNPLINSINRMIADAWGLALRIVKDNYIEERLIRYTGEDGAYAVMKFKGADLGNNNDVKVTSQTGLPRARALRIEYILRMREQGLITDDKLALEMLEFGNVDKIFKDQLLHERKAYRINAMIENNPEITPDAILPNEEMGTPGIIYQGEDHTACMQVHERLRLSTKYEKLTPQQQQTIDAVIQFRQQKLSEAAEAQKKEQIEMMVQAEMAKAGALAKIEQMKTMGELEVEKQKTKGDVVLEITKQGDKSKLTQELVKGAFGQSKATPDAKESKSKKEA